MNLDNPTPQDIKQLNSYFKNKKYDSNTERILQESEKELQEFILGVWNDKKS
jgi:hypothetical protein